MIFSEPGQQLKASKRMDKQDKELRPFWLRFFDFNWKFGTFLLVLICVPRFILVLIANMNGSYGTIGLVMLLSALAPFVFLSKQGRRSIGITGTSKYGTMLLAFVLGVAAAVVLHYAGQLIFGLSYRNWYVYIAQSYNIPSGLQGADRMIMFVIMSLVGMTFSPFGEEFFFRGIVHTSFARSLGEKRALIVDCSAFALTHLAHFGLVFINNRFELYVIPGLLWMSAMFLTSMLFYRYKKKTGSLFAAVLCHSGFNLGMIYSIFYLL
jgi:membrane protease YdiL (CAAX protease family)